MNTSALCMVLVMYLLILYFSAELQQGVDYLVLRSILLRCVSLVCLSAFISMHQQMIGLIGEYGLLPITNSLETIKKFRADMTSGNSGVMKIILQLVCERFDSKKDQNRHLRLLSYLDMFLSALGVFYPHPLIILYLYFSYYSLKRVCGPFLNFQWDSLLLETLVLTFLLSLSSNKFSVFVAIFNFKLLFFRLMLGAGFVKLFSKDESWNKTFTATSFHFLTQPLPTSLGLYLHHTIPALWNTYTCIATLVIENLLPLLSLVSRGYFKRLIVYSVFFGNIVLQSSIFLTGYYGFFNYLTCVLCLTVLDDSFIVDALAKTGVFDNFWARQMLFSVYSVTRAPLMTISLGSAQTIQHLVEDSTIDTASTDTADGADVSGLRDLLGGFVIVFVSIALFVSNAVAIYRLLQKTEIWPDLYRKTLPKPVPLKCDGKSRIPSVANLPAVPTDDEDDDGEGAAGFKLDKVSRTFTTACADAHEFLMSHFYVGCAYGLFASMTKVRNEIIVEVSDDKDVWQAVEFMYKPGNVMYGAKTIFPFFHMPRLDWALWFVALRPTTQFYPKWFWVMLIGILEDTDCIVDLMHPTYKRSLAARQKAQEKKKEGEEETTENVVKKSQTAAQTRKVAGKQENMTDTETSSAVASTIKFHRTSQLEAGAASAAKLTAAARVIAEVSEESPARWIRVSLHRYTLSSSSFATTLHPRSHDSSSERTRPFWNTFLVKELVPPSSLEDIYLMMEQIHSLTPAEKRRKKGAPTPETAADLIMRTMFQKLKFKTQ